CARGLVGFNFDYW
nr:immunoglobulin heavy chain junction region [Macaca mulatta]